MAQECAQDITVPHVYDHRTAHAGLIIASVIASESTGRLIDTVSFSYMSFNRFCLNVDCYEAYSSSSLMPYVRHASNSRQHDCKRIHAMMFSTLSSWFHFHLESSSSSSPDDWGLLHNKQRFTSDMCEIELSESACQHT